MPGVSATVFCDVVRALGRAHGDRLWCPVSSGQVNRLIGLLGEAEVLWKALPAAPAEPAPPPEESADKGGV